jgi:(1->4)-alpha-D-glucan 1-alpha-D-glucosylmutase
MTADWLAELAALAELQPRIPLATYRLQFHGGFTFEDARAAVPYLAALGISDVYASPLLAARPGSGHGYDVCDHAQLNPEIGDPEAFTAYAAALRAHGLGQILDVIPNHMGIAASCNRWWNDVLEHGPGSPYAAFFDIDWEPIKRELAGKVLLPILGDQYGRVLENQELRLEYADGAFRIRYYDTRLPLAPRSTNQLLAHGLALLTLTAGEDDPDLQEYESILTAITNLPDRIETTAERFRERRREQEVIRRRLSRLVQHAPAIRAALEDTLRAFNGTPGDPRSFDRLDRLLDAQAYRLAHWRVAGDEINYRRFFDVNELAAIRMENPAVFRESHRLILELLDAGHVTGLRLDHPDGLFDPSGYFRRLQQERLSQILARHPAAPPDTDDPPCRPLYLVVEKILGKGERLPAAWPVHGTTGYEFLNCLGGLFVDGKNEKAMTAAYTAFTGSHADCADIVYESKKLVVRVSMSSELNVLGQALDRLSERNRHSRDFTLNSLTEALREVIACFPVYRTYIDGREADVPLQDRACVEVAVAFAKRRNPTTNVSVYDFVRDLLLLRYPENVDEDYREAQRTFVRKFQQLTAPVTAKGLEDTAFYRYHRLVSLNEVGGDPDRFGTPVEEFHAFCQRRLEAWPDGLSATSTHDTKRSEDVRARIHVLSEIPREWRAAVSRWHRANQRHIGRADGQPAPSRNDEYLLYQTLVGAWPLDPPTVPPTAEFVSRIQTYILKATKEAKLNTSWINPNAAYDEAVRGFVARILTPSADNRFLADFTAFQAPIARLGMVSSLAQIAVKATAPGVPDFYQGTELWDFSLVDPDNRRPVDYSARIRLFDDLTRRIAAGGLARLAEALLASWEDGRIKLYATHRLLALRRRLPDLFRRGAYVPAMFDGPQAQHLVGFVRAQSEETVLTVVPRLLFRLTDNGITLPVGPRCWAATRLLLPVRTHAVAYRNLFTGERLEVSDGPAGSRLPMDLALARFPLAVLVAERAEGPGSADDSLWGTR